MNFIRPEIRTLLWQWREVLIISVLFILGLRWALISSGAFQWLGVAATLVALAFLLPSVRLARIPRNVAWGAGAVDITERRISYFHHEELTEISINELIAVDIAVKGMGKYRNWILVDYDGQTLRIPVQAKGADRLLEAISALDGAQLDQVMQAHQSSSEKVFTIWRRA